jgi:hypothetical protein
LTGANREMKNNPNYYYYLITQYNKDIPSLYEDQINVDLKRTFPEDPLFSQEATLESLRRILTAFSRRNFSIGYCQGFNFIAGRLFKIFRNEVFIM